MQRVLISALLMLAVSAAQAADVPQYKLVIADHQFTPTELTVPAGVKFTLLVENHDSTPEEFESNDFNREKIIMPNGSITVFVGPLKAGKYRFFGDFHQDTAQGVLTAE